MRLGRPQKQQNLKIKSIISKISQVNVVFIRIGGTKGLQSNLISCPNWTSLANFD